eukprot:9203882-Pyramimonas_sp.AAC.1
MLLRFWLAGHCCANNSKGARTISETHNSVCLSRVYALQPPYRGWLGRKGRGKGSSVDPKTTV